MAFSVFSKKSGKTYYLHSSEQSRKDGATTVLYYFAGDLREEGGVEVLPADYIVVENQRTGQPYLKKRS
ncbi:MAG: hypothetical protein L3J39_12515 [Verrucomicrobiales bacterium]|nr:hypothetical protein [Verrucomicrobiales bacterium]